MLDIPKGNFKAYIFDLDGTLINSMPIHMVTWNRAIALHGGRMQFDRDSFMRVAGVGGEHTIDYINREYGEQLPYEVSHEKERIYWEYMHEVKIIEPVVAHLRMARQLGIKTAIGSGGRLDIVERALKLAQLSDLIDAISCQDFVTNSKPAPDIFLLAAEKLGVAPKDCLVFEDSPLGITAADRAGMASILVPNLL